jgi:predicted nucleic acid-binding protein
MTDSTAKALVDTNVLIYAHDFREPDKQARAQHLLDELEDARTGVFSAQVLNEFYATITRPTRPGRLSPDEAAQIIRDLAAAWEVLPVTVAVTLRALDAMPQHGFSFWDALIWATAKEGNVEVVCTEDFQHGREVEGVKFINPFLVAEGAE